MFFWTFTLIIQSLSGFALLKMVLELNYGQKFQFISISYQDIDPCCSSYWQICQRTDFFTFKSLPSDIEQKLKNALPIYELSGLDWISWRRRKNEKEYLTMVADIQTLPHHLVCEWFERWIVSPTNVFPVWEPFRKVRVAFSSFAFLEKP